MPLAPDSNISYRLFSPGRHVPFRIQGKAGALDEPLFERIQVHDEEAAARGGGGFADQEEIPVW